MARAGERRTASEVLGDKPRGGEWRGAGPLLGRLAFAAAAWAGVSTPSPAAAAEERFCSTTAEVQFHACHAEMRDDYRIGRAICLNESEDDERAACFAENRATRDEAQADCGEQFEARRELCGAVGESRYDPSFEPEDFVTDFDESGVHPYFPLVTGHRWVLVGGDERIEIEVRNATKLIEGVRCVVVNDRVEVGGRVVEDTDDWFAQAEDGDVYYCGEEVKDFEFFGGDAPAAPELVSIDGSFKVGRDGDKPGLAFLGAPQPGQVYRQEFSAGNAEDAARVLSIAYGYGDDPDLDQQVPEDLAELLCADDCVVIEEFSPIEPGKVCRKYYAPGIGFFLETDPAEGTSTRLVDCNFDPRCELLPAP